MATITQQQAVWQKPATSALFSLLLVFLAGIAVGALAMSFHSHPPSSPLAESKRLTMEKWKKELDLTPDQSKQIEMLLDDFSRLYDNVLADGNSRILLILDDGQKAKFARLMKDRR